MKCLTSNEALSLCADFLVEYTEDGKGTWLRLRGGDDNPHWGQFRPEHYKQEFLARTIVEEIRSPLGYLVWFYDWNIFSRDKGLFEIVRRFRETYGETRSLSESPAFHCDPNEADLCKDLIRFAMAFNWGCYAISLDGKTLVEIHDEGAAFWGFDKEIRDELITAVDWKS